MVEKVELVIEGKKYIIKELTFEEADFGDTSNKSRQQINAEWISKCIEEPKLTPEEILKLPYRIASKLLIDCNKLNTIEVQYFTNSPMK